MKTSGLFGRIIEGNSYKFNSSFFILLSDLVKSISRVTEIVDSEYNNDVVYTKSNSPKAFSVRYLQKRNGIQRLYTRHNIHHRYPYERV